MRIRTTVTVLAALAGTLAFTASPAGADTSPKQTRTGEHCIADLGNGKIACADSEQQARQLAGVSADSVNGARLYDATGFGGATFTITVDAPCTAVYEHEYIYPDLGRVGWNNRAGSVRTYNSCDVKLYDPVVPPSDPDLTMGSTWIDEATNLGNIGSGWNNRAGSLRLS
jgi:hypothetical protein